MIGETEMPSAVGRTSFIAGEAMLWSSGRTTPGIAARPSVMRRTRPRKSGAKGSPSSGKSPMTTRFLSPNVRCISLSAAM